MENNNKISEKTKKYVRQYQKEHYKKVSADVKPELKSRIDAYCADMGISKADFLEQAINLLENQ